MTPGIQKATRPGWAWRSSAAHQDTRQWVTRDDRQDQRAGRGKRGCAPRRPKQFAGSRRPRMGQTLQGAASGLFPAALATSSDCLDPRRPLQDGGVTPHPGQARTPCWDEEGPRKPEPGAAHGVRPGQRPGHRDAGRNPDLVSPRRHQQDPEEEVKKQAARGPGLRSAQAPGGRQTSGNRQPGRPSPRPASLAVVCKARPLRPTSSEHSLSLSQKRTAEPREPAMPRGSASARPTRLAPGCRPPTVVRAGGPTCPTAFGANHPMRGVTPPTHAHTDQLPRAPPFSFPNP